MKSLLSILALTILAGAAQGDIGDAYLYNNRAAAGTRQLATVPVATGTPRTFINQTGTASYFGMDFSADANTLYAVDSTVAAAPTLNTLDLVTGLPTLIAPLTGISGGTVLDLAIAPDNTAYLFVGAVAGVSPTNLYTLNLATGAATLLSSITNLPAGGVPIDLGIDVNGLFYYNDIGTDSLYSLNPLTGVSALIGPTGFATGFAQGMDFDWATNTLYATFYISGGVGNYVTINTTTGAATNVFTTTPWNAEMEIAIRNPVPTPAGFALLGLGGLVVGRRKR